MCHGQNNGSQRCPRGLGICSVTSYKDGGTREADEIEVANQLTYCKEVILDYLGRPKVITTVLYTREEEAEGQSERER